MGWTHMAKRTPISASIRWSIFYRDGFACRYCGSQAGQDGVELAVDHVVSVADGGDNRIDNLVTACRRCNGGKGARSIREVPTSEEVVRRVQQQRQNLEVLGDEIRGAVGARSELEQQIVNLKCQAYRVKRVTMARGECSTAIRLLAEFGPDKLLFWYVSASDRYVSESKSIRYVCGCARNERAERDYSR